MTTDEIKAELRRSACEDEELNLSPLALTQIVIYSDWPRLPIIDQDMFSFRIFLLLVAEALE